MGGEGIGGGGGGAGGRLLAHAVSEAAVCEYRPGPKRDPRTRD